MRPPLAPFVDDLRDRVFAAGQARLVGAEVEFIPVDAETRRPALIEPGGGASGVATLPVLRAYGASSGWREERSDKAGVPEFHTPDGGRITFEPGGQLEFSAAPSASLSGLVDTLGRVVPPLRRALADAGIDTLTVGLDPVTPIEDAPLQLSATRYARMARHFASISTEGARMMRQTASIQVSVDAGPAPLDRWRVLNALAPYVAALFANSPLCGGTPTGYQSTRRRIWGALDPSRTGLAIGDGDPVTRYADFAMGAVAILLGSDDTPAVAFGDWAARGAGMDAWQGHLTTLFPEVRPRGHFEVRSCDALPPDWYAAPLVFLAGLAYGPDGGRCALDIAGPADVHSLEHAGRCGLGDPALAGRAVQLADLAVRECVALGDAFVDAGVLDRARDFFDRFTRVHRSPASDLVAPAAAVA